MSFLDSIGSLFGGLFGTPDVPAVKVSASESKVQSYDPRSPRSLCLGHSAWSTSIGWQRVHNFSTGNSSPRDSLTQVLCAGSHPMGDLEEIMIGEKIYTVGTEFTSGGNDFIPASLDDGDWDFDSIYGPAGWYIPNRRVDRVDRFWRVDGGVRRSLIIFKWFDGTQTTQMRNDNWMERIVSWTAVTRDFRNEACLVITWRRGINENVFSGQPPRIMPISDGAQNIHRWPQRAVGYSTLALDCFTHWLMWEYGPFQEVTSSWVHQALVPGNWDEDLMDVEATLCAEDVDDGNRYIAAYQIFSGQSAQEVFDTFDFLCGGLRIWRRPNGLWAARVGHDRAAVAHFDLDQIGENIVTRRRRPHAEKFNAVTVGYVSDTNLYEMLEAEKAPGAYQTADGGVKLYETITNRGRHGAASNKRLALIKLDRHRLEEGITFDCWHRFGEDTTGGAGAAARVEPGDIITVDFIRRGWVAKEFEVVAKTYHHDREAYTIECDEWGGIRFSGEGDTPEEVGDDGDLFDGKLSAPTGLMLTSINTPAATQPDGSLIGMAYLDVDDHEEATFVGFLGGYNWRWRINNGGDKFASGQSVESRFLVPLRVGVAYEIQAQVYADTAWGRVTSEWSEAITPIITNDFLGLPAPTSDTGQGDNLVADWSFERSAGLATSQYWGDRVSGQDGSLTFEATGGKTGPARLVIFSGTDAPAQPDQAAEENYGHPVVMGELYKVGAWVLNVDGTAIAPAYSVRLQSYSFDDQFLVNSGLTVQSEIYTSTTAWKRVERTVQIPPSALTPTNGGLESRIHERGDGQVAEFPTVAPLALNRLGVVFAVHGGAATVETNPVGETGASWVFRSRDTTTSGDDMSILSYEAALPVGQTISGGSVTQNAGDAWVVVGGALSGSLSDPTATPAFGAKGTANVQTSTATPLAPTYPTGIVDGQVAFMVIGVSANSAHGITTPAGWTLVRDVPLQGTLKVWLLGRDLEGGETGAVSVPWTGSTTGSIFEFSSEFTTEFVTAASPVSAASLAFAVIYRYTDVVAEPSKSRVQLRALYDDVNAETSTFAFDGILKARTDRFPIETASDVLIDTSTYADVIVSAPLWPPPLGKRVKIVFQSFVEAEVTGAITGTALLRLALVRRDDGGANPTTLRVDKTMVVFTSPTEAPSGTLRNSQIAWTLLDALTVNTADPLQKYEYAIRANVSSDPIQANFTELALQIHFEE